MIEIKVCRNQIWFKNYRAFAKFLRYVLSGLLVTAHHKNVWLVHANVKRANEAKIAAVDFRQ